MRRNNVNLTFVLFMTNLFCFGMMGCGGNSGETAVPTTTTTSTSTTVPTTTTSTNMTSTGNLMLTASFSPKQPKVGDLVTFSFAMDDPDASVDYVCGNTDYGFFEYIDHIPCPPRGCYGQDIGKVYSPVHGHREWTQTATYKNPGTYIAKFSKRSGDYSGCNPYGDDATLSLTVIVNP